MSDVHVSSLAQLEPFVPLLESVGLIEPTAGAHSPTEADPARAR